MSLQSLPGRIEGTFDVTILSASPAGATAALAAAATGASVALFQGTTALDQPIAVFDGTVWRLQGARGDDRPIKEGALDHLLSLCAEGTSFDDLFELDH